MDQEKVQNFLISKLVKTYRLLGVSFCFLLSISFYANAQTACSECYGIKRPSCEKRCKGSATRIAFSTCSDSCVTASCVTSCKSTDLKSTKSENTVSENSDDNADYDSYWDPTEGGGSLFHDVGGSCGKCLRKAIVRSCGEKCPVNGVEDLGACRNSCAKLACSSSCQLPNESEVTEKRPTVRDCGECKRVSEMTCHGPCEDLKDQPGYITCIVSCIEEKCYPACHPE